IPGLFIQPITKNPFPSPHIFALNPPPSFLILLITLLIPSLPSYSTILPIIPPFLRPFTLYTFSPSTNSITPIKLPLAPIAIHLFFTTITQRIIILNQH
ncbi:iron chelate uptake ABC transporter family permease subunit, partial [Staphylococcus epidermidis]|uniref:iron chelate uptake ABC transporter family permease subunit n=1 Tax=Staphylococcus epidermidis TaxID=1282 RepID=UPI0011A34B9C